MSTDDRLKALYRAATAGDAGVRADDVAASAARAGWPDEEGQPLDRVAASAAHADVLRTVMQLGPDADALARDVAAARRGSQARRPSRQRAWFALAAGVGAAAVLIAGLGQLQRPGMESPALPSQGSDAILTASFESGSMDDVGSLDEPDAIFGGDFDS